MNELRFKFFLIGILLLLVPFGICRSNVYAENQTHHESMVPTISGLDFNKTSFFIASKPEFLDRLYKRAKQHFIQAGLYKEKQGDRNSGKVGSLLLELRVDPIEIDGQKKFMYQQGLKFQEKVVPVRNPNISVTSVTWSYGTPRPIIVDSVSIEQLETDLDELITEFIRAYKLGNPDK